MNINTGELSLEQCKNLVVKKMIEEGILNDNSAPRVVPSLVQECATKAAEADGLPKLEINTM